jgi:glycosyltransferase involved in cell wall biosynthesis
MKLIYSVLFFGKQVSGVQKKILSQVHHLNNLGLPSEIFSLTFAADTSPSLPFVKKIIVPDLEYQSPKGIWAKIRRTTIRDSSFKKSIESSHSDDIVYTRMLSPSKITSKILKSPRKCKIVIEYQTIEPNERRLAGDYISVLKDFLYGGDIRKYCDGIVGVTDQITRYQVSRSGNPHKPHITIGNGFNVDSVSVRNPVPSKGQTIHLLCVANINRWHGLDRLIEGLGTYHGPAGVILHIAGDGPELPALKKLIDRLDIAGQVVIHGVTTGKDLDNLFDACHIAIGSLGLHRIGLTESSILKAREYCARGIPYISASADPDFPADFPYIFRIPAEDTPVDVEKVVEFSDRVSKDLNHPRTMRMYAVEHLDWSAKMKRLKAFLETLVDKTQEGHLEKQTDLRV